MRITLQRDGGDFPIPALNQPITLDTGALSAPEAEELRERVANAHFFDQPAVVGTAPPGAVGYFTYTLTAQEEGRKHTVQLNDFTSDPALLALKDYLANKR